MKAVARRLAPLAVACLLVTACAQGGSAGAGGDGGGDPAAGTESAASGTEPSGAPGAGVPETAPTPTTGASEPREAGALAFTAPLVAGGTFEGGDYDGRDVALWFWAPW